MSYTVLSKWQRIRMGDRLLRVEVQCPQCGALNGLNHEIDDQGFHLHGGATQHQVLDMKVRMEATRVVKVTNDVAQRRGGLNDLPTRGARFEPAEGVDRILLEHRGKDQVPEAEAPLAGDEGGVGNRDADFAELGCQREFADRAIR